jgi:hypothetical protein
MAWTDKILIFTHFYFEFDTFFSISLSYVCLSRVEIKGGVKEISFRVFSRHKPELRLSIKYSSLQTHTSLFSWNDVSESDSVSTIHFCSLKRPFIWTTWCSCQPQEALLNSVAVKAWRFTTRFLVTKYFPGYQIFKVFSIIILHQQSNFDIISAYDSMSTHNVVQ